MGASITLLPTVLKTRSNSLTPLRPLVMVGLVVGKFQIRRAIPFYVLTLIILRFNNVDRWHSHECCEVHIVITAPRSNLPISFFYFCVSGAITVQITLGDLLIKFDKIRRALDVDNGVFSLIINL